MPDQPQETVLDPIPQENQLPPDDGTEQTVEATGVPNVGEPGPGQHLSRGGQVVDDEPENLTPEQRHTAHMRKRERRRFEAHARVVEQIAPQLRDAGLA